MILPPAVLWCDPGGMTGLAWFSRGGMPGPHRFSCMERSFQEACSAIEATCAGYKDTLWIGWERYTIDQRRPQKDAASAIEVIGVCRYFAAKHGCKLLPPAQQASPSKTEQGWLKALGWWRAGEDDSQSAAAHLLRWLMQTNSAPPFVRAVITG